MPIFKKHNNDLYNTLLILSRKIFFYKKIGLSDTFETRIYLMFIHFSIFLIIFKKKGSKFDQILYDHLFHHIEYNLREAGIGDVAVNKKMKDFNKILYDILLKLDLKIKDKKSFEINQKLIFKYFRSLNEKKDYKLNEFITYFSKFYDFCFEQSLDNMIKTSINFEF